MTTVPHACGCCDWIRHYREPADEVPTLPAPEPPAALPAPTGPPMPEGWKAAYTDALGAYAAVGHDPCGLPMLDSLGRDFVDAACQHDDVLLGFAREQA